MFQKNIESIRKATLATEMTLLISAVICRQRKLDENKVTQCFWNQKYYEVRLANYGKLSLRFEIMKV